MHVYVLHTHLQLLSNVASFSHCDSMTHLLWRGSSAFSLVMDGNRKGKGKFFFPVYSSHGLIHGRQVIYLWDAQAQHSVFTQNLLWANTALKTGSTLSHSSYCLRQLDTNLGILGKNLNWDNPSIRLVRRWVCGDIFLMNCKGGSAISEHEVLEYIMKQAK